MVPSSEDDAPVLGVLWSNKGNVLVYNRFVNTGNARLFADIQDCPELVLKKGCLLVNPVVKAIK